MATKRRTGVTRGKGTRSAAANGAPAGPGRALEITAVVLMAATLILTAYARIRLAGTPLERDEGEYAYAGQQILQGTPPYELAYNMKFPGTYYAYAGLMAVFGQTEWGIRIGLLCVNLATSVLIFFLGRRLAGTLAGSVAASSFAVLSVDRWSMGVFAHATHFVALPVVAMLWLLHQALDDGRRWRFVTAGFLAGVAIVMKQQAAAFAVLAVVLAVWGRRGAAAGAWFDRASLRRGALVIAGGVAAGALLVVSLAAQGVLGRFWFWTFQYASVYASQQPIAVGLQLFSAAWSYITQATGPFWYAGIAGLALVFLTRWAADTRVFIGAWFIAAVMALSAGFYFRQHYFIVVMPVVAMGVGLLVAMIDQRLMRSLGAQLGRVVSLAVFGSLLGAFIQANAHFLFSMDQTELVRTVYAANPFLEAPAVGRYLNARTEPGDRIAILGSEPEILFYANRPSATGYIYMYPLTELQPYAARMRDEMTREVSAARPRYVVLVDAGTSWISQLKTDQSVVDWATRFVTTCYDRVGVADVGPVGPATILWDGASAGYEPQGATKVLTFRRRESPECR